MFKGYGAKVGLGNMRVKAENRMLTFLFYLMFFVKPGMDEYFELTDEGYKWVS